MKEIPFVIKIRKEPQIEANNPLNGIKIAVDAGHGGEDYGAIGPTGIKEKDINLSIAKNFKPNWKRSVQRLL